MCRNLSKYAIFFLFLALSGLIFLLRNIHIVENWNCRTISALYQLQSQVHSSFLTRLPSFNENQTFCAHLGQKPSPEDELEERYLLDSIEWPGPPPRSTPLSLRQTSDPVHSLFTILPNNGRREWHVGEQLEALVQMHDFQGRPKHYGGDLLLARLHSPGLGAAVAGTVVDHKNGIYSALLPLLWVGSAQVEVTLVHSSEAVAVLKQLREERPDRVFFKSLFRLGFLSETTVCNMCLPADQQPLCNYTDLYTGEPWYCYKPKMLSCDTRINHAKGGYLKHLITNKEALLFQSGVNIKVQIHASGADSINVLPPKDKFEEESNSLSPDHIQLTPSGYYFEDSWRPLGGVLMRHFDEPAAIALCLRNKVINMYGDSTVRQWFEYLITSIPEMKELNLQSPKNVGPFMAVDINHNIILKYRCHGPPIRFSTVLSSELRYISNELDGLSGGPNTVVVLSIWAHFSTFPVEVYVRRLRHIRRAVVRLLGRAPGTLVVIRSANLQALDQEVSLFNSDWFSLQLDMVLKAMFKSLNVLMVDAWEMSLAHHLPHALHPPPVIVKNMIDMVLSYVCPENSSLK
ncbi:NXPE family member 3 [Nothobranchius furzeri]|uniref:Neurexophilin and PC-esterase domain family member 3 n=1 Tax=Nothobranchius furzeri TaxID=105023 RepID=A0A1A8V1M4_NOTFU|nr:NXPE family member 3 [Nothobranchius furzeri]XP_054602803.1 NXPE family member 3 [Nothobranchius furzeri]XP_054602804.1 NXPE family member 3 [Nothobranchius furzeri]XP_054602805.1 NXPE family member 3 [Nothobranchius furzeri]XP_054602806.1 NXPE family member 3 [Nothobranchius furzeri]XP_054602807.1 NXPE family member 3 [Nothobranchius furzeri]KAF7215613.1 neurexophilin and PC-esterase domain family member 3 [Nothobranchius furzeri]